MLPVIEQLLVLQDRDRRRLRLEAELADLPLQQRRLLDKAARMAADADALKQQTRHLESERKELELEVASKQDFIRKCEASQAQTKSNEEYRRYAHQVETTRSEISALEDKQIRKDQTNRDIGIRNREFDSGRRLPVAPKKRIKTEIELQQNLRMTLVGPEYGDTDDRCCFIL